MLGNNTMETTSTEVTFIRRRNNVKKSTWKTHRYFVDFESRIHVEISKSNRCHNFHVDSPFKIDVISKNFPRGIATSNRWRIDEDVSIGYRKRYFSLCWLPKQWDWASTLAFFSEETFYFFATITWLLLLLKNKSHN